MKVGLKIMDVGRIVRNERSRRREHRRFLGELKDEVQGLPDASHAVRVAPRCLVAGFSSLDGNWSVEHHDFVVQKDMVCSEVSKSASPYDAVKKIKRIVKTGKIGSRGRMVSLHPDFRTSLASL